MSLADALAYEPEPPNDAVRPAVTFVVLVLAVWNLAGWIASDPRAPANYLLAALTVGFEFLAFNASVQMRRAHAKQLRQATRVWFVTLAMCSGWSVYSAHHALGVFAPVPALDAFTFETFVGMLKTAPAVVVLTIAACVIPLLPWAIETTEKTPAPRRDVGAGGDGGGVRNDLPANDISPASPSVPRVSERNSRTVAKALANERPKPPRFDHAPAIERVSKRAPPLSAADIERAVAEITKRGEVVSIRSVARFYDAPTSRVMGSPGKALIAAAKAA